MTHSLACRRSAGQFLVSTDRVPQDPTDRAEVEAEHLLHHERLAPRARHPIGRIAPLHDEAAEVVRREVRTLGVLKPSAAHSCM